MFFDAEAVELNLSASLKHFANLILIYRLIDTQFLRSNLSETRSDPRPVSLNDAIEFLYYLFYINIGFWIAYSSLHSIGDEALRIFSTDYGGCSQ